MHNRCLHTITCVRFLGTVETQGAFTRQRYWRKRNNFLPFWPSVYTTTHENGSRIRKNRKRWPKWKSGKRRSFIRVNLSCKRSKTEILGNLPLFVAAATKFLPVRKPGARVNDGRRQNRFNERSLKRCHRFRVNTANAKLHQRERRIGKRKNSSCKRSLRCFSDHLLRGRKQLAVPRFLRSLLRKLFTTFPTST